MNNLRRKTEIFFLSTTLELALKRINKDNKKYIKDKLSKKFTEFDALCKNAVEPVICVNFTFTMHFHVGIAHSVYKTCITETLITTCLIKSSTYISSQSKYCSHVIIYLKNSSLIVMHCNNINNFVIICQPSRQFTIQFLSFKLCS